MAKTYENYVFTKVSGQDPTINLFADLADAFDFQSVSGTDNNKTFVINSNLSLRFAGFVDMISSTSQSDHAYIYAIVNNIETEIYNVMGFQYTSGRRYKIVLGAAGDVAVQIGNSNYDAIPYDGTCLEFAIVNVQNTVDDEATGYGLYIPYFSGGIGSAGTSINYMNATPRYLFTADTEEILQNSNLTFTGNAQLAHITSLVPIFGVGSECVTTSSYALLLGHQSVLQGKVKIEGVMYYCIGGFYMIDEE